MKDPTRVGYFIVAQLKEEVKNQIHFGDEGLNYKLVSLEKFLSDEKIIPAHKSRIEEYLERLC